ncbi:MAG: hypothetical protein MUF78_05365 [Candidatus Edwardsbacteria bacterium]|jgi:hypothetical protein|nr:hypothetical protein [Candidatus Edwardsbacteria bacterium]
MRKYVGILSLVVALAGCATPLTNYRITREDFNSRVTTIAILPFERMVTSDRIMVTKWPVKDSSVSFGDKPIEYQAIIPNADPAAIDSFAAAVESLLVERFRALGYNVIPPQVCERTRQDVYLENGIVTQADIAKLRRDTSRQHVVRKAWLHALPSAHHLSSTAVFTVAGLRTMSGTSFKGPVYAVWDGRRDKMFAVSNAMVQGKVLAMSIGLGIADTTDALLWDGRGGLTVLRGDDLMGKIRNDDNIREAIGIALSSLKR